ncbi:DNA-binding transcriptional regulator [Desulfovibrio sp. DV]|uniref:helix-turn-helix domain-containing protein n=1 Tax=Desulfovibrio sp. DV TaxID=1844708 RepID=UPI00094BC37A|nr:helix-turn-helix domain-containing protein [Desulfovibrio sp. DV]
MKVEYMKQLRDNLNITQAQMAKLLNISQSMIAKYEGGVAHPTGEIKRKIEYLIRFLDDKDANEFILNMLAEHGGIAAVSGLLGICVASNSQFESDKESSFDSKNISGAIDALARSSGAATAILSGPLGFVVSAVGLAVSVLLKGLFSVTEGIPVGAIGTTGILGATATTGTDISMLSGESLTSTSLAACGGGMAAVTDVIAKDNQAEVVDDSITRLTSAEVLHKKFEDSRPLKARAKRFLRCRNSLFLPKRSR